MLFFRAEGLLLRPVRIVYCATVMTGVQQFCVFGRNSQVNFVKQSTREADSILDTFQSVDCGLLGSRCHSWRRSGPATVTRKGRTVA